MELFLGAIGLRYGLHLWNSYSLAPVEQFEVIHSPKINPKLIFSIDEVLANNPHRLTLLQLLDYHGNLQTAAQFTIRNACRVLSNLVWISTRAHYKRELYVMGDGGTVALDWIVDSSTGSIDSSDNERPIVILLHGIIGDSQSEYIYFFAQELYRQGFLPAVLVSRGCGDLPITSPTFFAGKTSSDLFEIIHYLHTHEANRHLTQHRKIFLIGYSLGAASLLHYLGHVGNHDINQHVEAAIAICPPWNCGNHHTNQPSASSWMYSLWISLISIPLKLHYLKHHITLISLAPELYHSINVMNILFTQSIRAFDELLFHTYPRNSFLSTPTNNTTTTTATATTPSYSHVDEYYDDISPINFVHHIHTIPTLILTAIDDPVCNHHDVPSSTTELFGHSVITVSSSCIMSI